VTTTCSCPAPVSTGRRSIENGPGGTCSLAIGRPFTKTSTVDGTTASPWAASSGVVTSIGCVLKLVPNCSPPKRTARPQGPGVEIESPTRSVAIRSGKSRVQVVSRRAVAGPSSP